MLFWDCTNAVDKRQRLGRRDDARAVIVLQIAQVRVTRDDQIGVDRERAGGHMIIQRIMDIEV